MGAERLSTDADSEGHYQPPRGARCHRLHRRCEQSEQTPPLPAAFELVRSAEHTEDGWTVHCVIDATISITSEIENGWTGTLLGHVVRTIVRPDGSVWSYAGPWPCRGLDPAFDPRPGLVASGTWQLASAELHDAR
jgi:hypothetical protein